MPTVIDNPAYQRDVKDAEADRAHHDIDEATDLEQKFGYIQELPRVRRDHTGCWPLTV